MAAKKGQRHSGMFRPGQSGNPSGRPKTPEHVKEMLRALTDKAVQVLANTLDSDDEKLRLTAAQEVLNRTLGKPVAPVDMTVKNADGPAAMVAALRTLADMATLASKVAGSETIDATPIRE